MRLAVPGLGLSLVLAALFAASVAAEEAEEKSYYERYEHITSYRIDEKTELAPRNGAGEQPQVRDRLGRSPSPLESAVDRADPLRRDRDRVDGRIGGVRVEPTTPIIGPVDPKPAPPGSQSVGGRTRAIYRSHRSR